MAPTRQAQKAATERQLHGDVQGVYEQLAATVRAARETGTALNIVGGGTKSFYGRRADGTSLPTAAYDGIVEYEASELVITLRAGTSLRRVEETLAGENQMLAFEPPCFGAESTIGGVVAAGLSGPRRPYAGAVRDAVLGVAVMPSTGELLSFGGRVMKNVAGYDVSRLMAGAMGTLGLLLIVSLRVGPRPQSERTFVWQLDERAARARMIELGRRPWPLGGVSFDGEFLRVRMSGHAAAVDNAELCLAPDRTEPGAYWDALKNHTLPFFQSSAPLWRLSVLPAATRMELAGDWLWDWGGGCRWLKSEEPNDRIRAAARAAGGHATLFRGGPDDEPFAPLDPLALRIHQRLKQTFDPERIFNPGRMYGGL